MRSVGILYNPDGSFHSGWTWNEPDRNCPFHLPVQQGHQVLLIDPEHEGVDVDLCHAPPRRKQEALSAFPPEAITDITVSLPFAPGHDHYLTPGLMIVKKPKGDSRAKGEHDREARIERG